VTDLIGDKIETAARLKTLERLLMEAAGGDPEGDDKPNDKKAAA